MKYLLSIEILIASKINAQLIKLKMWTTVYSSTMQQNNGNLVYYGKQHNTSLYEISWHQIMSTNNLHTV
jgi:hypothetical protein